MKNLFRYFFLFLLFYSKSFQLHASSDLQIATDNERDTAYKLVSDICEILNRYKEGFSCISIQTSGAEENLANIKGQKFKMAVLRESMPYYAFKGVNDSGINPRILFALYHEYFSVIGKSDIHSILDLKGKNIAIAVKGTNSRNIFDQIIISLGLKPSFFGKIYEIETSGLKELFCNNQIDAALYFTTHPNEGYAKSMKYCNVKFAEIKNDEIKGYLRIGEYYSLAKIPEASYPNLSKDIPTFGSSMVLSAASNLDQQLVYQFTKSFFTHFDEMAKSNSILKNANALQILRTGCTPYLHKGSARYYREEKLLDSKSYRGK